MSITRVAIRSRVFNPQIPREERADAHLVLRRAAGMEIFVGRPFHRPEALGRPGVCEERLGFRKRSIAVNSPSDEQQRCMDLSDARDGLQLCLGDADVCAQDPNPNGREQARDAAQWAEPGSKTVAERLTNGRIHGLQYERIRRERASAKQRCRASHRNANDTDSFCGYDVAEVGHCGYGVEAFARAEGHAVTGRFAMRLKVGREHREAFGMEEGRPPQHAAAI